MEKMGEKENRFKRIKAYVWEEFNPWLGVQGLAISLKPRPGARETELEAKEDGPDLLVKLNGRVVRAVMSGLDKYVVEVP